MRLNKTILKLIYTSLAALIFALPVQAQTVAEPIAQVPSNNHLGVVMIIIAFVLAFVIWGMGQVLTTLARQALEKSKQVKNIITSLLIAGFTLWSLTSNAQDAAVAIKELPNYGGLSATSFWVFSSVIFIELMVIAFLMFLIKRFQQELLPQKVKKNSFDFNAWWSRADKKLFTKAVPVEKEADILLEHEYDGIQELDNSLPPWWKYGFYITIGIAIIYFLNFHVFGYGKNPAEEYEAEMSKAKIEMELYASKSADKIDENNITMPDADGLARGKQIFSASCWPCHGKLGEGGAGPNLTDDHWLHKGSLNDIYQSIKHGYPDKGMQAWEKNFSPKEISYLAGFIKSLKGSNPPNAKAPEGDVYTEQAP